MNTSVRFKNLEPSDALKSYVSEKLNRMEKYFNGPAEASVVLSIEKFRHSAEINIIGDRLTIKRQGRDRGDVFRHRHGAGQVGESRSKKTNRKVGITEPRGKASAMASTADG
jgi:putative sigma-54 modulation protein